MNQIRKINIRLVQFYACRKMYLVISKNEGVSLNIKAIIIHFYHTFSIWLALCTFTYVFFFKLLSSLL